MIDVVNGKKPKSLPGPPPASRANPQAALTPPSTSSQSVSASNSALTPDEIELIIAARKAKNLSVSKAKTPEKAVECSESDDDGLYELGTSTDVYSRNMALLTQEREGARLSDDDEADRPPHKKAKRARGIQGDDATDINMMNVETFDAAMIPPLGAEHGTPKVPDEETDRVEDNGLSNGIEFINTHVPKTPKKVGGKITRNDFTPRTRGLADDSKNQARASVIAQAYPPSVESAEWAIIGDVVEGAAAAAAPNGQVLLGAYERVTEDPEIQRRLLTYVGYGLTAMRTDLVRKARVEVRKELHLAKLDEEVVKSGVLWALKRKNYVFAGLDIERRTNDRSKPFGFSVFESVIGEVCFGVGKVNHDAAQYMIAQRQVPLNLIGLIAAMIEHCLKEWSSGAHALSDFSDEIGRAAHAKNMRYVLKMQTRARKYMNKLQVSMLRNILRDQDKLYALEEDSDVPEEDFQGIDFDALEKEAGSPNAATQAMDA